MLDHLSLVLIPTDSREMRLSPQIERERESERVRVRVREREARERKEIIFGRVSRHVYP